MTTELTSSRLVMSPLRADDADEMFDVLDDAALHEFIGGSPATLDELRVRYATLEAGSGSPTEEWLNWIVRRGDDGAAIGYVQATVVEGDQADIAWVIGVPWQRNGLATEAASAMVRWLIERGVTSFTANIHPDNVASSYVAAHIGLGPTDRVVDGETVWTNASA
jgi:RimJ/RimL family protein N-acetyltransferase